MLTDEKKSLMLQGSPHEIAMMTNLYDAAVR